MPRFLFNPKLKTKNLKLSTVHYGKIIPVIGCDKDFWYSAGLRFACSQCGKCCAGPEQGYIWISRPEIRLIADFLKMSAKEAKQKFMRPVGFRFTIIEAPQTRDCVFLQETKQGRRCIIYEVRPAQCRNWPFWEWNLESPDTWAAAARKCPGVNRGRLYTLQEIRDKVKNKKWWKADSSIASGAKDKKNEQIVARVSEIYKWIDEQLLASNLIAGRCLACGKCCDFEKYEHRLYVTTPEIIFFADKIGKANIKQMTKGQCCYQIDGKCSIYAHRFAGCRIFCCRGNMVFQSELTEAVLKRFKALCEEFKIPYQYVELSAALKIALTVDDNLNRK